MKSLCILLISSLLVTSALAQTATRWQPYVRAGAGASRAIGEQTVSSGIILLSYYPVVDASPTKLGGSNWLLAGNIGAGIVIPVSQHFSIQAEVNVEQKGSSMAVTKAAYDRGSIICDPGPCPFNPTYTVDGKFSSRLTYLTMQIMASYRFGRISLAAGPYIGYKLAEGQRGSYSIMNSTESHVISTTRGYEDVDMGFVAGIGYAVTSHIGVDLRYSQGLIYVAKPYYSYSYGEYTEPFYNQTAQVGVRYNLLR